jgi:hypothetical protein
MNEAPGGSVSDIFGSNSICCMCHRVSPITSGQATCLFCTLLDVRSIRASLPELVSWINFATLIKFRRGVLEGFLAHGKTCLRYTLPATISVHSSEAAFGIMFDFRVSGLAPLRPSKLLCGSLRILDMFVSFRITEQPTPQLKVADSIGSLNLFS